MRTKNEKVNIKNLHPRMRGDLETLDRLHLQQRGYDMVVTSGEDGKHTSVRSQHYNATAVDIRTWTTATSKTQLEGEERAEWLRKVRQCLGSDWVVLDEDTHFHLGWRPIYREERYG